MEGGGSPGLAAMAGVVVFPVLETAHQVSSERHLIGTEAQQLRDPPRKHSRPRTEAAPLPSCGWCGAAAVEAPRWRLRGGGRGVAHRRRPWWCRRLIFNKSAPAKATVKGNQDPLFVSLDLHQT